MSAITRITANARSELRAAIDCQLLTPIREPHYVTIGQIETVAECLAAGERVHPSDIHPQSGIDRETVGFDLRCATWGDYSGSTIERANHRSMLALAKSDPEIVLSAVNYPHSTQSLAVSVDVAVRLLPTLRALADYPVIDDDVLSDIEMELTAETVERIIDEEYPELSDDLRDDLRDRFHAMLDNGSHEARFESAIEAYIPSDDVDVILGELNAYLDSLAPAEGYVARKYASRLTEALFMTGLDSGLDREAGSVTENWMWAGLLVFGAYSQRDVDGVTQIIPRGSYILTEDSQGFVGHVAYASEELAESEFAALAESLDTDDSGAIDDIADIDA